MNLLSQLKVVDPAVAVGCRAFAVPDRVPASLSEGNFLDEGSQATIDVDEERITFWKYGSGPAILLMHGWCSRGSHLMGFVRPLVAAGFSVVLFDAPGHGHSTGTSSSVTHAGRAALTLAMHFGGIHGVIAHSAGSLAALWAVSHGLWVHRSVHISGPTSLTAVVLDAARAHNMNERQTAEFCAWAEAFMGVSLASVDLPTLSVGLRHPGLIIHDSEDSVVAVAQSQALHVTWTRSTLIETIGLGHRRILTDPSVIQRAVEFMGKSWLSPRRRG